MKDIPPDSPCWNCPKRDGCETWESAPNIGEPTQPKRGMQMIAEGTMAPNQLTMAPANTFGGAVQPTGGGRLKVDVARLKMIYQVTSSDEKKKQDRKTCGILHSDFTPDQSEYEDDRGWQVV